MCKTFIYFKHFLIFISVVSGYVSTFAFTSLVAVPVATTSSAVGIKTHAITARIKKYKSIKKKRRNHDKVMLPGKGKLDTFEVLTSKALVDSYISHNVFVLVDNVLREI